VYRNNVQFKIFILALFAFSSDDSPRQGCHRRFKEAVTIDRGAKSIFYYIKLIFPFG
jgi:hypothetical protein